MNRLLDQIKLSGQCKQCEKDKNEFISIVFMTGNTLTMCMDCYAEAMRKISEANNKDTGVRA
jgi:hypothetical protein